MANRALDHVKMSPETMWSVATTGEAYLMLGDLKAGCDAYRKARSIAKTLRDCESMYMQAIAIVGRIFGDGGLVAIDLAFEIDEHKLA